MSMPAIWAVGIVVTLPFTCLGLVVVISAGVAAIAESKRQRDLLRKRAARREWADAIRAAGGQPSLDGLWVIPGGQRGKVSRID